MTDKMKKILIIGGVVVSILVAVMVLVMLMSDDDAGEGQVVGAEYTPPPLSDNPPMSGSDIDAITQQVREQRQRPEGASDE